MTEHMRKIHDKNVDNVINVENNIDISESNKNYTGELITVNEIPEEKQNISVFLGNIEVLDVDAIVVSDESDYENVAAKTVVRADGPTNEDPKKLEKCYTNTLKLAETERWGTVAFKSISTEKGYPKLAAAEVAVKIVRKFIKSQQFSRIIFCVSDLEEFCMYQKVLDR